MKRKKKTKSKSDAKTKKSPPVKKLWTVAVYMAGDNDLDNNGKLDLAEMKKVGSTGDMNVVAQFDSLSAGSKTTRYEISKGPIAKLATDAKQKLGTQNTGDPQSLIDFIGWVAANYPAEHYLLVLWNHGQGWDDTDIFARSRSASSRLPRTDALHHAFFRTSVMKAEKGSRPEIMRAILIDDNSKDFLDNIEMKKVLQAAKTKLGQKLDIFGMDACLMNQAEVIYQVRANALFAVGSELTEPLDGWPYTDILSKLANNPSTTPAELAKIVVSDYIASYKSDPTPVTQSAVDVSKVEAVANAVDQLGQALLAAISDASVKDVVKFARFKTQQFDDNLHANVDLDHFCELVGAAQVPAAVKTAAASVRNALASYVIANGNQRKPVENARGVSIYFPTYDVSPLYSTNLDFAKQTSWTQFLNAFVL